MARAGEAALSELHGHNGADSMRNHQEATPQSFGRRLGFRLIPKQPIHHRFAPNVGNGVDVLHVYEGIPNTPICE
jgi:hypothetical protein